MFSNLNETEQFLKIDTEKQGRIIDAAVTEFAEKGYTSASMNVVSEKANIAKGSLFKYFGSKDGLFGFIYSKALYLVKDYLRKIRDESRGLDFFTRLERLMAAGVEFIEKYPQLARIYFHIIYTGDAPYKTRILQELHVESLEFIATFIEDGIKRGELRRDINVRIASFMLESLMDRFLQAHYLPFLDPDLRLIERNRDESKLWIDEITKLYKIGMGNTHLSIRKGDGNES